MGFALRSLMEPRKPEMAPREMDLARMRSTIDQMNPEKCFKFHSRNKFYSIYSEYSTIVLECEFHHVSSL